MTERTPLTAEERHRLKDYEVMTVLRQAILDPTPLTAEQLATLRERAEGPTRDMICVSHRQMLALLDAPAAAATAERERIAAALPEVAPDYFSEEGASGWSDAIAAVRAILEPKP